MDFSQIHGVKDKTIYFKSRAPTTPEQTSLHILVSKKSISETIKRNENPFQGLYENKLLNLKINYVEYSEYKWLLFSIKLRILYFR